MTDHEPFIKWVEEEYKNKRLVELCREKLGNRDLTYEERLGIFNQILFDEQPRVDPNTPPTIINSHPPHGKYQGNNTEPKFQNPGDVVIGPVPNLRGRFVREKRTRFW